MDIRSFKVLNVITKPQKPRIPLSNPIITILFKKLIYKKRPRTSKTL